VIVPPSKSGNEVFPYSITCRFQNDPTRLTSRSFDLPAEAIFPVELSGHVPGLLAVFCCSLRPSKSSTTEQKYANFEVRMLFCALVIERAW